MLELTLIKYENLLCVQIQAFVPMQVITLHCVYVLVIFCSSFVINTRTMRPTFNEKPTCRANHETKEHEMDFKLLRFYLLGNCICNGSLDKVVGSLGCYCKFLFFQILITVPESGPMLSNEGAFSYCFDSALHDPWTGK